MSVIKEIMNIGDHTVSCYTMTNKNGMSVKFLNYGGIITEINTKDHNGTFENVVLGFKDYKDYFLEHPYFGALIGRVAGRIEHATFKINGHTFELPKGENGHSLHGGPVGLNACFFDVTEIKDTDDCKMLLTYVSHDGDQGYPGEVTYHITYHLSEDDTFSISYDAISTKDTVLTLTNHSYFNLSGGLKDTVRQHLISINASRFVELDEALIPTGNVLPVLSTPFDLRTEKPIETGIVSSHPQNIVASNGYDHYFIFDHTKKDVITLTDKRSKRTLRVQTDQPGVVMYTATTLDASYILKERNSCLYLGVCLETQSSPASLVHDGLPSIFLAKNERYQTTTHYQFGVLS